MGKSKKFEMVFAPAWLLQKVALKIKTVFTMNFVFEIICHPRRILIVKGDTFIRNEI